MPTPPKDWKPAPELLALMKSKILLPEMKLPTLRREVPLGYKLPWFYGMAYLDWSRPNKKIAYPVPLNLFVWFGRWLWWQLIRYRPEAVDEIRQEAFHEGYQEGQKVGYEAGRRASFRGYDVIKHL